MRHLWDVLAYRHDDEKNSQAPDGVSVVGMVLGLLAVIFLASTVQPGGTPAPLEALSLLQ